MHSNLTLNNSAYGFYFSQSFYFSFGYFALVKTVDAGPHSCRYRR